MPLSILFGSQTGSAENLARRIAKEAGRRGFAPTVHEMNRYPLAQLGSESRLLVVTSTYGDGEPPDNAREFWQSLATPNQPLLAQLRFSVCALGDSNYPKFCGFGKELDARLETMGATRITSRADCDLDFEEPFTAWLNQALTQLSDNASPPAAADSNRPAATAPEPAAATAPVTAPEAQYSRANPFPARLLVNRTLNGSGSAKETRHFEITLEDSKLSYDAGDALGILPANCADLVDEILKALGFTGGEAVPGRVGTVPVREALLHHYEITRIPPPLLRVMAERSGDEQLRKLAAPGVNGELTKFLWGREIIDVLLEHRKVSFNPIEFVGLLKKLNPRLYSISSSPKAHRQRVHLTVNVVRYESFARRRKGVCSTFLADRLSESEAVPVFVHANKNFRLPSDPSLPMIMIGPGTGIAPFRGFLHERAAIGAHGRTWLFFGDQRAATDFMYRDELESLRSRGVLTRLNTAFSRDQPEKIYVQDRMRENARDLFAWLEEGAHFYVCGDASRMAKDVDAALHDIIQTAGGKTAEAAKEYVAKLKSEKRYQRDVY
ncbi:MAG TPA: sulfite reductase subunit alpha [Verrucomicrobiae bacterium]|nr:sulfite reductase subunit alpha [Verrucomicrobiae bacterium]